MTRRGRQEKEGTLKCSKITEHFFLLKKDDAKTKLPNKDNK